MRKLFSQTINDIPMGNDVSSRYVCWIVGLMVYLLSLVFMGAMSLSSSLSQWQGGGVSRLTIEVPIRDLQNPEYVIQNITSTLEKMPGVVRVHQVDNQEVMQLLQPWVGQANLLQELRLPALIDVDMKPDVPVDVPELTTRLGAMAAGIRVEEHHHWQQMFQKLRLSLEVMAYLFMGLIGTTVMVTITLITRSSLATHASIIDILRLMGASSSYIACKFQKRAFRLALKGGFWGGLAALPTVFVVKGLNTYLGISSSLKFSLNYTWLISIILLPFIVGGMSWIVARISVLRTLAKLG